LAIVLPTKPQTPEIRIRMAAQLSSRFREGKAGNHPSRPLASATPLAVLMNSL
jgi:hypothetical protein